LRFGEVILPDDCVSNCGAGAFPADKSGAPSMAEDDLARFVEAQSRVYRQVVEELTAGHKLSHWMWFIFPQLSGLGHSAMAQQYAIDGLDEARRYLDHPVLGHRLREAVRLMLRHTDKTALEILGSPDDLKFRSCLTLYREAASDRSDRELFTQALGQFYNGEPDPRTLQLLRAEQ
jgi:uncharacterized protein (DUF1810 family)